MRIRYKPILEGSIKVPLPDVRQQTDWSCGASALQAVCGYFGVGPEEEEDIARHMRVDHRVGAHPYEIADTATRYGLEVLQRWNMTLEELRALLDDGKPVLLMIQAWANPKDYPHGPDYGKNWKEGHWVAAIGYDREGVYFEDPSLAAIRGYLPYDELMTRWHDTGPRGRHIPGFGMAIWKPDAGAPAYYSRAEYIG